MPLVQRHDAFAKAGRDIEALDAAKQLVALEKKVAEAATSIAALQRLSVGWRRLGRFRRAAAAYDALWCRVNSRDDLPAQTRYTIAFDHADVLHDAGRLYDAARASEDALELAGELCAETSREYGLAQSRLAQRLYALGEYGRSAQLFEDTLSTCSTLLPKDRVSMQSNLAKAQIGSGTFIAARETLAKTEILLDTHELWTTIAAVGYCDAAAQWARAHTDYEMAILHCRRSLTIAEGLAEYSERKQANTLNLLGGLLRADDRPDEALDAYLRALSLAGSVETLRIDTVHNLAACLDHLGRGEEAEARYHEALKLKVQFYGPRHPSVAATLHNLGLVSGRRNDADEARLRFDQALSIENDVLGPNDPRTLKTRFSRALLLHRIGERAEALGEFGAIAHAEERILAELTVSPDTSARRRILLDALDVLDAYLDAIAPAMQLDAMIASTAYGHVRFRKGLAAAADQMGQTSADQVMEKLVQDANPGSALADGEVLIDFVFWPSSEGVAQIGAFIVVTDGTVTFRFMGESAPIRDDTEAFLAALQKDDAATVKEIGQRLRHMLIPEGALDAASLVISPDGPLCQIPFAALWHDDGWLGLTKTISYVAAARDLMRLPAPSDNPSAVFAAPAFGLSLSKISSRFTPLQGAKREGDAVADVLGVPLFSGRKATAEALESVKSPRILHIATHGALVKDEEGIQRAIIAMANANMDTRDGGGVMSTRRMCTLDLDGTKLVTLSACRSMIGENHRFDNMDGMRRAVQASGAICVLSSVLPVGDRTTATFMHEFYRRVRSGLLSPRAIATALRDTQRFMHEAGTSPRDWASWSLYR